MLGSHAAAAWEGSRSSAFYFEFLFQRCPFTPLLFLSPVLSGLQSFYCLSLSHFHWCLLAPSPLVVFSPSLIPEFSNIHSCSILKYPVFAPYSSSYPQLCSFLRRKQLCIRRRKSGSSYLALFDNRNSGF